MTLDRLNTYLYHRDTAGNYLRTAFELEHRPKPLNKQSDQNNMDSNGKSYETFQPVWRFQNKYYTVVEDRLIVLNEKMAVHEYHDCRYLEHCRDTAISGKRLFMASSGYDAILVFDLASNTFIEGYHIRHNKTSNCIYLAPFDPNSPKGPTSGNQIQLNTLFVQDHRLYFSCLNYDRIFYAEENGALHMFFPVPQRTIVITPFKQGILLGNEATQTIVHMSMDGAVIKSFSYPVTSQARLRQLTTTDNEFIIAAFEPATLSIYKSDKTVPVQTFTYSEGSDQ